ncbi:hypothetical protein ACLOJK_038850 [Asimina triloba]
MDADGGWRLMVRGKGQRMGRGLKMVLLEALLARDGRTAWLIGGCREASDLLACVGEEVDGRHLLQKMRRWITEIAWSERTDVVRLVGVMHAAGDGGSSCCPVARWELLPRAEEAWA